MENSCYILLEGLPGAGKSTLLRVLREQGKEYSLLPDYGNPKDLSSDFVMDHHWIVDIESQKSRLALRPMNRIILQERGYLSILACHHMFKMLNLEDTYDNVLAEIRANVKSKRLIIPNLVIISLIEPKVSKQHQPGTKLSMWSDLKKLEQIQQYYLNYAQKPLFREKVVYVEWSKLQETMLSMWNTL